jgi:3-oxoacyl-[acyl-carrier-protein] synthase-3
MVSDIRTVIDKYNQSAGTNIDIEDIDRIYPHQANLRIIEMVAKKLHIPSEKVYSDGVVKYGNTSAASIPIGYYDTRDRYNGDGGVHLEIDVAFGSGFASGAILRRKV